MRINRVVLWALLAVLLSAVPAAAQVTTAQINGTVTDSSGAAVAGAKVTVTNPETGVTRTTETNSSGYYAASQLMPGKYELRIEKGGFSTVQQKGVELRVGQQSTLDFQLKPGEASVVVEVTGEAPLIETTKSEIGGSVSPLEVKELPILDRNFSSLMNMVPGVRPAAAFDPTKTRSGNISLNGSDGRAFDYNVDGGDNKDNVIGGIGQNYTMEGIQEFNVITNRYTAEAGRTAAGIVNVVTKSGTNTLHGSLFSLFQVSTLNKIDKLTEDQFLPKPVYHRYHFGGSVGGAVIKDKFFFFGAYEQKREPGSISVEQTAFDELSLFPLADPVTQLPVPFLDHLATVRLDWNASDRHMFFGRYGFERWTNPNDQLGNPFIADLSQTQSNTNRFHDLVLGWNWTIAQNKVNAFNAHVWDFVNGILAAPERTFTVPVAGGGTATNPNIVFPSAEIGTNVNVPQTTLIRKYQFRDDFSWTVGKHNMKMGVNYIYMPIIGGFFFFGANGYQIFFWDDPSTILSDPVNYPSGFATPGALQALTFSGGSGDTQQDPAHSIGLYFQDDWKIHPRLTLNLGVRWDANPNFLPRQLGPTRDTTNRTIQVFRDVLTVNPAAPAAQEGLARMRAIAGEDGPLRNTTASWEQFQPRIGFAWDVTGRGNHVIRGGYGISRDQVFQNLTLFALQQARETIYQTLISAETSVPPGGGPCTFTGAVDLCAFRFGVDPLPAPIGGFTEIEVGAFGRINDPRINDPWSQQMSIGWAWQFHPDYALSVDYYHVLGTHEPRVININPRIKELCDPAYPTAVPGDPRCVRGASTRYFDAAFAAAAPFDPSGAGAGRLEQINMIGTNNRSLFDSVNFQLKKRFGRRVQFQTSYVLSWSRSWGGRPTASYSGNGIAITPERQFLAGEFRPTIFDERHRFVFSGYFDLGWGVSLSPIIQASSARPYTFRSGTDTDGDGRTTLDRVCVGSIPAAPLIPGINAPFGCEAVPVNTLRGDPFYQVDLRAAKAFTFGERMRLNLIWELHNLFNRANFCNDFGQDARLSTFQQPLGYCGLPDGGGFSQAATKSLSSQFGFRFEF